MGSVTGTARAEARARDAVCPAEETMGRPTRAYAGRAGHAATADVIEVGVVVIGKGIVVLQVDPSAAPAIPAVLHRGLAGLLVEGGG